MRAIRSVVESCDLILSVSRFTRDEIINRLSDINTTHVKFLPNGVDVERFYPCEVDDLFYKKYSLHQDSDLILTLARIIKRKAHDDVIKALPDIINDFPKAHYVIAGPHRKKDSYLESLKILVKELSLENNVTFIDFIPDEDLKKSIQPVKYILCQVKLFTTKEIVRVLE